MPIECRTMAEPLQRFTLAAFALTISMAEPARASTGPGHACRRRPRPPGAGLRAVDHQEHPRGGVEVALYEVLQELSKSQRTTSAFPLAPSTTPRMGRAVLLDADGHERRVIGEAGVVRGRARAKLHPASEWPSIASRFLRGLR